MEFIKKRKRWFREGSCTPYTKCVCGNFKSVKSPNCRKCASILHSSKLKLKKGIWSKNFPKCVLCGDSERRHEGRGLCSRCANYGNICKSCGMITTKGHNRCRRCKDESMRGIKLSLDHRKKLSEIRKQLIKEGKIKIKSGKDNHMYGKHLSQEILEKKRQSMKKLVSEGKLKTLFINGHTPWLKDKTAEDDPRILSKENHWHWKNGITPYNVKIRNSLGYKQWRNQVFDRDNYICQKCYNRGGPLRAHHLKKFSEYPELRHDINNGLTLCKECHDTIRGKENEFISHFEQKISLAII